MKKYFCFLLACLCIWNTCENVKAQYQVSAQSAVVIDASTGRIVYEKNAYTMRGMASTTKIMTALLSIENLNTTDIVTVTPHAAGVEGSSIWLSPMEHMSVNDLLYGLMLASGNDAATALAETVAGSEEAFVLLMNKKAKEIGAYNTNFTNPHGLPDDNHYTTAYDLALISKTAMENPFFAKIVKTQNKSISWEGSQWNRSLTNHNKLLKKYSYAIGIKTGFTKKDGRCLVSCAEKDGKKFICVTLSAPDDWNDHMALYDECFDKYSLHEICSRGDSAGIFTDENHLAQDVQIVYGRDFSAALTSEEADHVTSKKVFDVTYPVYKGQIVGYCNIYCRNEKLGSINLVAANDSAKKKRFTDIFTKVAKGIIKQ